MSLVTEDFVAYAFRISLQMKHGYTTPVKKHAYVGPDGDRPQITKFSPMTQYKTMLSP